MSDELESDDISLESLSARIDEIKNTSENRYKELVGEISTIRKNLKDLDDKTAKRLDKLADLIGDVFEHMQLITNTMSSIGEKLSESNERGKSLGKSVVSNRQNLVKLSNYVKDVNKLWVSIQEEVEALKEDNRSNTSFRIKVIGALSAVGGLIFWLFQDNNFNMLMNFIRGLSAGSGDPLSALP